MDTQKFLRILILFFISWYVLLCTLHLFHQRPMWNDELCVFQSIEHYSSIDMFTKPLRALQVFPRVHLFLIQKISKSFDYHLISLRFLSFLFMISAFFVWLKVASYEMKNKWEYMTFVLSWPASVVLLYYSAELKQYSMDVLAGALYLLFLYNQEALYKNNKGYYLLALILLPFLGFFSYVAYILAMAPLYNLFVLSIKDRKHLRYFVIYLFVLCAVLTLSYYFDMRLRPTKVLSYAWASHFMSYDSLGMFFKTWGEGTNNLFSNILFNFVIQNSTLFLRKF